MPHHAAYAPADPPTSRGHLLDLHLPPGPATATRPVLVVTGGSAWTREDGKDYAGLLAPWFTARGWAVAGVSVRSSAVATFPAQVHDIKAAIRWLRAHADEHGLDPRRFAVWGDSSGGWTASMAGLTGGLPGLEGDVGVTGPSSEVQAVVDLYGPTDFLAMDEHMLPGSCDELNEMLGITRCHNDIGSPESLVLGVAIGDDPDRVHAANPATYVQRDAPPFFIVHGREDRLIPHHQSELLHEALRSAGVPVVFHSVPGVGHDTGIVDMVDDEPLPQVGEESRPPAPGEVRASRPTALEIERFLLDAFERVP